MTVIAGAVSVDGTVRMAADTTCVMQGTRIYGARKIRRLLTSGGHPYLLGFAGSSALASLTEAHLPSMGIEPAGSANLDAWAQAIAEAICKIATDATPQVTEEGNVDGVALLGHAGHLWLLAQQNASPVPLGYIAIGSGRDLALGVLASWQGDDNTDRARVATAVRIACQYDTNCAIEWDGPLIETLEAEPA